MSSSVVQGLYQQSLLSEGELFKFQGIYLELSEVSKSLWGFEGVPVGLRGIAGGLRAVSKAF